MSTRVLFITGTDTGVGKTLATALLLRHLRNTGARALALKPFCSGGRQDAQLLCELQQGELTLDEVNPFYFPEAVAPLISARQHKTKVALEDVLQHIRSIVSRLSLPAAAATKTTGVKSFLLIEGSGGLLVPLGEGYMVRDLIARLACEVVVVSRNQLGTINHTLLTVQALPCAATGQRFAHRRPGPVVRCVALMDAVSRDLSCRSNPSILSELLAPVPVICVPFLGKNCGAIAAVKKNAKKFQKTLARFVL